MFYKHVKVTFQETKTKQENKIMNNLKKYLKLGYRVTDDSFGVITMCKSKNGRHKLVNIDSKNYKILSK